MMYAVPDCKKIKEYDGWKSSTEGYYYETSIENGIACGQECPREQLGMKSKRASKEDVRARLLEGEGGLSNSHNAINSCLQSAKKCGRGGSKIGKNENHSSGDYDLLIQSHLKSIIML